MLPPALAAFAPGDRACSLPGENGISDRIVPAGPFAVNAGCDSPSDPVNR